jgi:DNA-binding FrmR family transcriptional regulator
MAHTIREKKKLLARVGRIRGQVEAIERALAEEADCERIMHSLIADYARRAENSGTSAILHRNSLSREEHQRGRQTHDRG